MNINGDLYCIHHSPFPPILRFIQKHFFPIVSSFFSYLQERRIAQQREVLRKEREIAQKMAARAYTKQYMSGLLETVFTSLRVDGYFFDPVERGQLPVSPQKRCHSYIWI